VHPNVKESVPLEKDLLPEVEGLVPKVGDLVPKVEGLVPNAGGLVPLEEDLVPMEEESVPTGRVLVAIWFFTKRKKGIAISSLLIVNPHIITSTHQPISTSSNQQCVIKQGHISIRIFVTNS